MFVLPGSMAYSAVSQPLPRADEERRHALLDGAGAEDHRLAGVHEDAARGLPREAALEAQGAELVGAAVVVAHAISEAIGLNAGSIRTEIRSLTRTAHWSCISHTSSAFCACIRLPACWKTTLRVAVDHVGA